MPAEESRLRELYPTSDTHELARMFGRTAKAIASRAKILKVVKAIGHHGKVRWTRKMEAVVRRRYPEMRTSTLALELGVSTLALHQRAEKLGIKKTPEHIARTLQELGRNAAEAGRAHRFPKGHAPANKGTRRPGWHAGRMRETQFRKGQQPQNTMPMWSFRFVGGYLMLKTGAPTPKPTSGWEYVHKLIWEQANGPLPDWQVARLWWKDRDHANCALSNLELVSAAEHMKRTIVHILPAPLPQLIQLAGALKRKIRTKEKRLHGQEHAAGPQRPSVRDTGVAV